MIEITAFLAAVISGAASAFAAGKPMFEKHLLEGKYFCDGISTGAFNRDGKPDIAAGPYWYEGPDFRAKPEFYPAKEFPTKPAPTDSVFGHVWDSNGDRCMDILTVPKLGTFVFLNQGRSP